MGKFIDLPHSDSITMMKIVLSLALVALATASHYHKLECKYNGQFLPNGYDQCSYIRCDYGDEPWYDEHGNIKFVPVVKKCPYGTAIDLYKDFSCHGYHCPAPCSVHDHEKCIVYRG